ncbi:MAG: DNA polymerase III subunit psi [Lonepinella koalarum]|nr:DNA polymerase III subunit psi [Lonepinella koalarum]
MNRRDLLLQEMGISQWQLRRPEMLKGAVNIVVGEQIRLIVVCKENQEKQPIIQDLLRSAAISGTELLWINQEQAQHLSLQHPCHYWFFTTNSEKNDRTSPIENQLLSYWEVNLTELKKNASQKRAFWQHIQQHLLRDD